MSYTIRYVKGIPKIVENVNIIKAPQLSLGTYFLFIVLLPNVRGLNTEIDVICPTVIDYENDLTAVTENLAYRKHLQL